MEKKQQLRQTYINDVELAASKAKFGFFSIPPSVFAGDSLFQQKKVQRDESGKLRTQQRNIFSGMSASGVLKKSFFSYPQHKAGDNYLDPGRADRIRQMKSNLRFKDKQVFRTTTLNKTLSAASYEYLPQRETRKDPKTYKTQDGKVRTQNLNVSSSPTSKIQYKSLSQLKYIGQPYQNARILKRKQLYEDISQRGQNPFKSSSPTKQYFAANRQKFGHVDLPKKKLRKIVYNIQQHDSKFKPGGDNFNGGQFSYPQHMPQLTQNRSQSKLNKTVQLDKRQPFRLIKQQKNTKPCPSISLSKMNLMKCL